jgi:hypothetical protein
MDSVLQRFESTVVDKNGDRYDLFLYGRSREHDTWQGWIVFERKRDGRQFPTDAETTQPNREAVLYWATGLTDAYFDGALDRALRRASSAPVHAAPPLIGWAVDGGLQEVEAAVLALFQTARQTQLLTQSAFDALPHPHATVVRALEDLEKQGRLLVRRTEQGSDWLLLTEDGVRVTGLTGVPRRLETVDGKVPKIR